MADDQAPPPDVPTESSAEAGTPQTPVFEASPEPVVEPIPEAATSESVQESVTEPQSEPVTLESKQASAPTSIATNTPEHDRELLVKARAKIETIKQQKLAKVLGLFDIKEKITNDDVEKILRCSDATALRYLNELIKQGKIQRVGKTGAGVEYVKA